MTNSTSCFSEPTEPLTVFTHKSPFSQGIAPPSHSTGVAAESSDRNDDATLPLPPPARQHLQPDAAVHLGSAMHQDIIAKKTRPAEIWQFREQMVEQVKWNIILPLPFQFTTCGLIFIAKF